MRKIIPYNQKLVPLAKKLRQNMTLGEILLWNEIKNKQLGFRFSRQIPIDEYIVDFYCKDLFLAIEVDGVTHTYEDQSLKDEVRQKRLEELGVRVLRFDDFDVKNKIKWVVNEILKYIETHPQPLPRGE
ncbi:endonuclease domain-containing protein [Ekhidna sp.]|uniref:endonuclease domain-containing protein n=1 Tax=Ekhidna sp. TaxID=2608089 RepID=UPI003C7B65A2